MRTPALLTYDIEMPPACLQKLAALVEHGYSMTLFAWSRSVCGIVIPNTAAVLRLMTSSNFVGCCTGRSPGLAPFRILSTYVADCRNRSRKSGAYDIRPPDKTNSL